MFRKTFFYRLQTKLPEGNVFTGFCLSTGVGGVGDLQVSLAGGMGMSRGGVGMSGVGYVWRGVGMSGTELVKGGISLSKGGGYPRCHGIPTTLDLEPRGPPY